MRFFRQIFAFSRNCFSSNNSPGATRSIFSSGNLNLHFNDKAIEYLDEAVSNTRGFGAPQTRIGQSNQVKLQGCVHKKASRKCDAFLIVYLIRYCFLTSQMQFVQPAE